MITDEIRIFFSQLNFAEVATNVPDSVILRNENNGEMLYVVIMDNNGRQTWGAGMISTITSKLLERHAYPQMSARVLFLIVTNAPARDKTLTNVNGATVWLVDSVNRKLMIYENQASDFVGLRYGLEKTIESSGPKDNPWDIKTAVKKKDFPFVTVTLIAVNVIWFIVLSFMGDTTNAQFMWKMGADFGYSVFVDHEFYRLLFSMFMHFGFMHLAGNMLYLGFAGTRVEKSIGHLRFFLIYMLAGLASSLLSTTYYYFTDQGTVSAGASGAIYGIIGVIIYLTWKNRGILGKAYITRRIMIMLIFLFYSNFITPGIDVVAHLVGLIFGLLLSIGFLHTRKKT